jgi:hypothetical protein
MSDTISSEMTSSTNMLRNTVNIIIGQANLGIGRIVSFEVNEERVNTQFLVGNEVAGI